MLCKRSLFQTRTLLAGRNKLAKISQAQLIKTAAAGQRSFASKDNFMSGANANYIDHMYAQWQKDPASVDASWNAYFTTEQYEAPPTLGQTGRDAQLDQILGMLKNGAGAGSMTSGDAAMTANESVRLSMLVRAFMTHGHLVADIDPLNMKQVYKDSPSLTRKFKFPSQQILDILDYKTYGFTEADLDRTFHIEMPYSGTILKKSNKWKLRDLLESYQKTYTSGIGVEFMHICDREKCDWIREKFEELQFNKLTKEEKLSIYSRINESHSWGQFMGQKFNTMKRFGLEGCESFIPGLKAAFGSAIQNGARNFIIGMPHRGRLNTLANVVRKPKEEIMAEFQGTIPEAMELTQNSGDVKYHLGTTLERDYGDGEQKTPIKITILANPSHLEAVNPVVHGRARAEQHFFKEDKRDKVVPIIVHGDAAFAGQGIVYECLQMQDLPNYTVGGTIHVIVNNQVGFTTSPYMSRSGQYCTDVAKGIDAPIFHVNGDRVEDVSRTFAIAAEYRQKFNQDVVIDLIGYRKMGHNELDQPMFTQPMMYSIISKKNPVRNIYRQQLLDEGITEDELKSIESKYTQELETAYEKSKTHTFNGEEWESEQWQEIKDPQLYGKFKDTGVDKAALLKIGEQISVLPENKKFHPAIKKVFKQRNDSFIQGKGIDWGSAEALAFASLIDEGYHVRISGQDVERGTFSHRHAHVFYQDEDGHYNPINSLAQQENQTRTFIASNSHLSEYAVLGFEYGYAITHPKCLVLWEAQFGDFANGAQIMIDQFVASGETKWNVKNGLVMLLPHGFDGNGPEHSSCRIERYLQLTDADDTPPKPEVEIRDIQEKINMRVVNATTAAQYFHVLRSQVRRAFRKPLIVVSPKKLLKLKSASSTIEDFDQGLRFRKMIDDCGEKMVSDDKIRRVVFCSGQVYYDLEAERTKRGANDVAIIRVEQLAPFPFRSAERNLKRYKNADILWSQEEAKNQGAWSFIEPRMRNLAKSISHKHTEIKYGGRNISASTATGYGKHHVAELAQLLKDSFE